MPSGTRTIAFNADIGWQSDNIVIRLLYLSGEEHCTLVVPATEQLVDVEKQCMATIGQGCHPAKVVLPNGEFLRQTVRRHPSATIGDLVGGAGLSSRDVEADDTKKTQKNESPITEPPRKKQKHVLSTLEVEAEDTAKTEENECECA